MKPGERVATSAANRSRSLAARLVYGRDCTSTPASTASGSAPPGGSSAESATTWSLSALEMDYLLAYRLILPTMSWDWQDEMCSWN